MDKWRHHMEVTIYWRIAILEVTMHKQIRDMFFQGGLAILEALDWLNWFIRIVNFDCFGFKSMIDILKNVRKKKCFVFVFVHNFSRDCDQLLSNFYIFQLLYINPWNFLIKLSEQNSHSMFVIIQVFYLISWSKETACYKCWSYLYANDCLNFKMWHLHTACYCPDPDISLQNSRKD